MGAAQSESNNPDVAYGNTTIPAGIRSRMVTGVNGITMHALEAGFETAEPSCRAADPRVPGARL